MATNADHGEVVFIIMTSLMRSLERIATEHPHHVPFRSTTGESLSYREWASRAARVAGRLHESHGVEPGDLIELAFEPAEWHLYVIGYIATIEAGATVVTARGGAPRAAVEVDEPKLTVVGDLQAGSIAGPDKSVLPLTALDGPTGEGVPLPRDSTVDRGDYLAEIIHTSGTTGEPKAVGCQLSNLEAMLYQRVDAPAFTPTGHSVLIHHVPLGTLACQRIICEALRKAGPVSICVPDPRPEPLLAAIRANSADFVGLVPITAHRLVTVMDRRQETLRHVKLVTLSSAKSDDALLDGLRRVFPRANVIRNFGATECGAARISTAYGSRGASVGRAAAGTRAEIRDDAGRKVPCGVQGELWLACGASGRSYVGDDAATAATFRDGWARTGDLARMDADGYVYVIDRMKDVVLSGGEKIGTLAIEEVLRAHRAIIDAAVFGLPAPLLGERVAAAVVIDQAWIAAKDVSYVLREHCAERLRPPEIPSLFIIVDELPRTTSGKVLKRRLREDVEGRYRSRPPE